MGDKYIWFIASAVYGITSGLIYALIARYRRFRGNFWRRFIVWSVVYTLGGLLICAILRHYLAD